VKYLIYPIIISVFLSGCVGIRPLNKNFDKYEDEQQEEPYIPHWKDFEE